MTSPRPIDSSRALSTAALSLALTISCAFARVPASPAFSRMSVEKPRRAVSTLRRSCATSAARRPTDSIRRPSAASTSSSESRRSAARKPLSVAWRRRTSLRKRRNGARPAAAHAIETKSMISESRAVRDLFLSSVQPPMGLFTGSGSVASRVVRPRRARARSMRVVASMGSSCCHPSGAAREAELTSARSSPPYILRDGLAGRFSTAQEKKYEVSGSGPAAFGAGGDVESAGEGPEAGLDPVEEAVLHVAAIEVRGQLGPRRNSRERGDRHERLQLLEPGHHLVDPRHPAEALRGVEPGEDPILFELPRVCLGGERVESGERSSHLAPEEIQLGESNPDSEDEIREVVAPRARERPCEDGPRFPASPGVGERESEVDLDGGAGMGIFFFAHQIERAFEEWNRTSGISSLQIERAQGGFRPGGPGLLLERSEDPRGTLELALGKRELPLERGHRPFEIPAERPVERVVAARRGRGAGVAGGGARVVEPADVEERL